MTNCICNIMHGLSPRRKLISTSFSDIFLRFEISAFTIQLQTRVCITAPKNLSHFIALHHLFRYFFLLVLYSLRISWTRGMHRITSLCRVYQSFLLFFFATRINLFNNFIFKNTLHLSISVTIIIV